MPLMFLWRQMLPQAASCQWSLVKDVRTRWRAHDQELIDMVASLQRLIELSEQPETTKAA